MVLHSGKRSSDSGLPSSRVSHRDHDTRGPNYDGGAIYGQHKPINPSIHQSIHPSIHPSINQSNNQ